MLRTKDYFIRFKAIRIDTDPKELITDTVIISLLESERPTIDIFIDNIEDQYGYIKVTEIITINKL